jgi:hypothetical protein
MLPATITPPAERGAASAFARASHPGVLQVLALSAKFDGSSAVK